MSFLGKAFKTVINVAALPVEVAKDVITLGGVCTGEDKPYTAQRLEKLVDDAEGEGSDWSVGTHGR